MENFPIKVALTNVDKRTNIKQIGVSATISERIKFYCDSREKDLKATFRLR
jgi:hypothetical protein